MEEEYLPMSGIQHFCFCKRQWALIHLERQWQENFHTAEGRLQHERCHDDTFHEKRKDLLVIRGMRVMSHSLQLSGVCDVVEFYQDTDGVELQNQTGRWRAVPVEYKHGEPKKHDADRLQVCAQAMALEEMLVCQIPVGHIFYEKTRRRETVELTAELRQKTKDMAEEMNGYFRRGYTPKVKTSKQCQSCSLVEICLPKLCRNLDVKGYIEARIKETL